MRPFIALVLFAALGAMVGCATTETGGRFASRSFWKKPPVDAKQADSKPAQSETAAKSDNPFRKTAEASKPKETAKPAETAATTEHEAASKAKVEATAAAQDKPPVQPETKPTPGEFNIETMKLIDEKLSDASPEERTYWYEQLKRVDPAVIPQILEARRLTADIVERRQSEVSTSSREMVDSARPFPEEGAIRQVAAKSFSQESSSRQRPSAEFPAAKLDSSEEPGPGGDANRQPAARSTTLQPAAEKPHFAVQKTTGTEPPKPPPSSPPSLLPNLSVPRNALNRLLPNSRHQAAAESAANAPAAVSLLRPTELEEPATWNQQLASLISLIEADVAQLKPGTSEEAQTDYIKRHVYLRMLYLMAEHPERALTAIPGIDSADQEFWQQTLWGMTNYFDVEHLPLAKDRAGQAVAQLAAATQRLRERSNLEIHNLAFCSEITHFGNFLRFPRDEFHPGERVLLYAEIENFKSELTIDGAYRTLIRSSMEILSPAGDVRWQEEFQAEEDLCTSYRRDYFHNYTLTVPDRLPLGPHTLKLTVFDELSGKMVSQSVNFVVR